MSTPGSKPTVRHQDKAIARHKEKQQTRKDMGLGVIQIENPNREQRRAQAKLDKKSS